MMQFDHLASSSLKFFQSEYEGSRNPLYAWDAIELCSNHRLEYPQWIRDYLSNVAEQLREIENPGKRVADDIKYALGFEDAGRQFTDRHKDLIRWEIVETSFTLAQEMGSTEEIYRSVADKFREVYGGKLTERTVRDLIYKRIDWLSRHEQELLYTRGIDLLRLLARHSSKYRSLFESFSSGPI